MPVINSIAPMKDEVAGWRRELHQNPQTSYEEEFAAGMIAEKLTAWGIKFKKGIATTGVVATIEGKSTSSGKIIGLRADIDALNIIEKSNQPWSSKNPGKMHACGHDGHTATMLGVAKYLNETKNFDGIVHLIFQPAEEGGQGALRMIEQGLFTDFPCDYIFGVHNWPWMPAGKIATRVGPLLAAVDEFEISITGVGGHAAFPHTTVDPALVAGHLITALQSIVSRNIDPVETAVLSVTNVKIGTNAFNIIGDTAYLNGTVRTFSQEVRHKIKARIESLVENICTAFGATSTLHYDFHIEPTINTADGVEIAVKAAADIVGIENVITDCEPCMGGEDFGAFLALRPGAFVIIGQGTPDESSPHNQGLHSPFYDFNDEILPTAISYFVKLVEQHMALEK